MTVGELLNLWTANASNVMGTLLIPILLGAGFFVTIRMRWIQLRKLGHSFAVIGGKYDNPSDEGDVSHFQALSAALAATIGIGNIAGVALAVRLGGPVLDVGHGAVRYGPEVCRSHTGA